MTPQPPQRETIDGCDTSRRRRRRVRTIIFLILSVFVVCICCCIGAGAWVSYELGIYSTKNKIRITNQARKAFLEAAQTKPESVLFVKEYETFAFRANLRPRFQPSDDDVISVVERGVPIMIDSGSFRPFADDFGLTIIHNGGPDKSSGYEVVHKGRAAYYAR